MRPVHDTASVEVGPSVAVIGGGFGGIAAAQRLKSQGIEDFVVYEKSDAVGGTWNDNRYPGAETDAQSHLYCYSFAPYAWSRTHVRQPELSAYLEYVVDRFDLRRHFAFRTVVQSVTWDEDAQGYAVRLSDGSERTFRAVISAVGMFSAPRYPDLPGMTEFRGTAVHTAHWDPATPVEGKRIAVMGTGSSASQVVPTLAPVAERITVFQRQPAWVLPKNDHDFSPLEKRIYSAPGVWKLRRGYLYFRQDAREVGGRLFDPKSRVNARANQRALTHVRTMFADRPDLQEAVTPTYSFGGKRAILSTAFYQALGRDDVELVPRAIVRCTENGVVDSAGVEREVDVLVLATGFQAADYLTGLDVIGRDGRKLHDHWAGEPYAFLGLTVPGFPNFFMLYGPNTNGGLIVSNLEHQASYAVKEIKRLRRGVTSVEPREDVVRVYNSWLQKRLRKTAFNAADNYFKAASGRIVTQWPDGASVYALFTLALRRISTVGRRRRRPVTVRSPQSPAAVPPPTDDRSAARVIDEA